MITSNLSFFATLLLVIFIIPILKWLQVGQSEREDGPKSHLKKSGTPTMGGIIMAISIIGASIVAFGHYMGKEPEIGKKLIPLILAAIGFGLVGFIDDYKKVILRNTDGLKPSAKMLGLLIVSVLYVIYITQILNVGTDIIIPFFKTTIKLPLLIYIPFTIFVILATTNAINLTDGGMLILFKLWQYWKALSSIETREEGIVICSNLLQNKNVFFLIKYF